ncbi:MAG: DUF58 domain-containing protein [Hamadaea sp.]|uniref:DUF58 domain-containing protein n=1 Tax=Hamadaea sp. TaxID=2024425 RepID=UPI0017A66D9D|nr:DUF58 domain-containing protein [Hamadaea sp.]NUT20418.1 DUF58 domain-containing protein [Hamadaea sp.]
MTRPTARGLTTAVCSAALLTTGLLLAYREMVMLGAAGLAAVALSSLWALSPPRVVVDRLVEPRRVRRGEPAMATADVVVLGRFRRLLTFTDPVREAGGDRDDLPSGRAAVHANPGLPARVSFSLPTGRRGVFHIGPVRVGRDDPLGLWSVTRPAGPVETFTVWPAWHRLDRGASGTAAEIEGERDLVDAGSITFHALREYVPGDDLRHIHWRTSARAGTLMVRTHVDAAVARLVLVLDDRLASYSDSAAFEEAVEVAASVVVATVDSGRQLRMLLASGIGGERSIGQTQTGLDQLAAVRLTIGGGDVAELRARLTLHTSGDAVLLVTGAKADLTLLGALSARYRSVGAAVVGPPPEDPLKGAVFAPTAAELVTALPERLWNASSSR